MRRRRECSTSQAYRVTNGIHPSGGCTHPLGCGKMWSDVRHQQGADFAARGTFQERRSRGRSTPLRGAFLSQLRRNVLDLTGRPRMADTTSVLAAPPVSEADLARAQEFTREPFLHEGEEPDTVLAPGSPRRRALEDALAEIDAGPQVPSVACRREYALMLGLERLLNQEEPHLADGTVLSAHQVDALSGTLIALLAELQESQRNGSGPQGPAEDYEDLPPDEDDDEDEEEDEDELDT